jgi:hypothetical protein
MAEKVDEGHMASQNSNFQLRGPLMPIEARKEKKKYRPYQVPT